MSHSAREKEAQYARRANQYFKPFCVFRAEIITRAPTTDAPL